MHFILMLFALLSEIEFLLLPKLKIVDHDIGQHNQDFEVSEVQWSNQILIDFEESWLCSFV